MAPKQFFNPLHHFTFFQLRPCAFISFFLFFAIISYECNWVFVVWLGLINTKKEVGLNVFFCNMFSSFYPESCLLTFLFFFFLQKMLFNIFELFAMF